MHCDLLCSRNSCKMRFLVGESLLEGHNNSEQIVNVDSRHLLRLFYSKSLLEY